jgi:phospholipid/cholesterol/gamma-HCH transport system ATP-binding protein
MPDPLLILAGFSLVSRGTVQTSGQDIVIEFRDVSLNFDEHRVLDNVSFRLPRSEMLVITGDSGSGKSVLLRLAIGLLKPASGEIFINGQNLGEMSETEIFSLRSSVMGLVFQKDTLFTGMSVYENTAFRLVEHEWKEADIERAVMEILHFVGLENDAEKLPEELSIGMRKRLELARALVGWPSIMLFDEPTSGLDPINARQVLDLIIRARDIQGISSLVVTKEMNQIPHLAKFAAVRDESGKVIISKHESGQIAGIRVMVLDHGRISFEGSYLEFATSALDAVRHLTNPESGIPEARGYIKDPWKRKPSPKK